MSSNESQLEGRAIICPPKPVALLFLALRDYTVAINPSSIMRVRFKRMLLTGRIRLTPSLVCKRPASSWGKSCSSTIFPPAAAEFQKILDQWPAADGGTAFLESRITTFLA
jgi:hypothetical protein